MITKVYNVTGMTCQGCASSVNRVISRNKGVDDCEVRQMEGEVVVTYDESLIDDEKIMSQITRLGFKASIRV
jgi:copper chaperone CopZ